MENIRHPRLLLAASAGLSIALGAVGAVPVAALEPVDGPAASPAVECPNPNGGGACLGPLAAGTYRTTAFETPFTFTVPDGWANYEDLPGTVLLVPPGGSLEGVDIATSDNVGVAQGVAVAADDCSDTPQGGVSTSAEEIVAALAAREGLVVSDPGAVEVGGLSGLMIDIAYDPEAGGLCSDPEAGLTFTPVTVGIGPASFSFGQFEGFTTRLYLFDTPGGTIVIDVVDVAASPGTVEDYLAVLDSIEFSVPS